jgi:LysR family nitrogen assimilation transcriptional regulator
MKNQASPALPGGIFLPPAGALAGRALELRELRYFHSVARTGNFGRAARELNITQPAVTTQVSKLEEGLGTQLLIRHGRGVTLTPAGVCLAERIDVIMRLLATPLAASLGAGPTSGSLTLAMPAELMPVLGPRLIEACATRWPGLTLVPREGTSAALEEWVLDGRADIAVLQDAPVLEGLVAEPVAAERLGLVSGVRANTLEHVAAVRVRQLAGLTLILPDSRHWIRRLIESAAFRRGFALERVRLAESVSLAKEMARGGLGFAVLPYAAVRDEAERGGLLFRPIEHDPVGTIHTIAWRRENASGPLVPAAGALLRDTMSGLARRGEWPGATAVAVRPAETFAAPLTEAAIG